MPKKQSVDQLRATAALIQNEIVDLASEALLFARSIPELQREFFVPWRVSFGGMHKLCRQVVRDMHQLGNGKTDQQPTVRQQKIAADFDNMRRSQRLRAVMIALRGHKGSGVSSIRRISYPALPGYRERVIDERPFIDLVERHTRLGGRAVALAVCTNPQTELITTQTHPGTTRLPALPSDTAGEAPPEAPPSD